MLFDSKEKQDLYVQQLIKSLVYEQAAFNISKREAFHSWHEVFGYIHEELKELYAEIEQIKNDYTEYECLMMIDAETHHMVKALNDIEETAKNIMQEACHVGAVALKGIEQLKEKGTCYRPR